MNDTNFPSRYPIGHSIQLHPSIGHARGVIVGVSFSESKVKYDIDLSQGGETMRNVDSCFVCEPIALGEGT